jgi:hypothetical protein
VGRPRPCADFVDQRREALLASIWTSGLTECHLWVSGALPLCQPFPIYREQRTSSDRPGMSQRCQRTQSGNRPQEHLPLGAANVSVGSFASFRPSAAHFRPTPKTDIVRVGRHVSNVRKDDILVLLSCMRPGLTLSAVRVGEICVDRETSFIGSIVQCSFA